MTKLYPLLLPLLFLLSCKTAGKAYEKGNYTNAIELAIKKLQKDPADDETKALLQNAYRHLVNEHEDKIRLLSNSNSDARWDKIYSEYIALQTLYQKLRQYPATASAVQATDYSSYITTYSEKAAEVHTAKALTLMNEDNKAAYRDAYTEFRKALRYIPDNLELKKRADEAYQAAIVKVVVVPMDNYGGYTNSTIAYPIRRFQEDVIRNLNYQSGNNFVVFFSEWDARSNNVQPDEVLEMRLGSVNIGLPYDEQSIRDVSKEVVIKEVVHKPDSVVKQYGKVYAKIITTRRTLISAADLFLTIRDEHGRVAWNDQARSEHRWQTEFATYQGNERALSNSDKNAINNQDHRSPREDDVLNELLRQLQNDLTYRLRNYYNRYN